MWINIIDYRGDSTVINNRGDNLFEYRTRYFLRQQAHFKYWKSWGHKFRCFTQHNDNSYQEYDDVVYVDRGNPAASRNKVLDFYRTGEWIAIWDNDVSLYWNKLNAWEFVKSLESVCDIADNDNIQTFVPFNPLVSPYPKTQSPMWTFQQQIVQNAMIFCKVSDIRFDETLITREDFDFGCQYTLKGLKTAMLANISLQSMVNGKSTIFTVNAYHDDYYKPEYKNKKYLLKWDAQLDRKEKYKKANEEIEKKYKMPLKQIEAQQRNLWHNPIDKKLFINLFEYASN